MLNFFEFRSIKFIFICGILVNIDLNIINSYNIEQKIKV